MRGRKPDLSRTLENTGCQPVVAWDVETARDPASDLRRLVEAALRMAQRVQRHGQDRIDGTGERNRRSGEQLAEHARDCELPAVLERLDERVDRLRVAESGDTARIRRGAARAGTARRGGYARPRLGAAARTARARVRQSGVAIRTQIERRLLARTAAEHATRRQHPGADSLENSVKSRGHLRLTRAGSARNTARDRGA